MVVLQFAEQARIQIDREDEPTNYINMTRRQLIHHRSPNVVRLCCRTVTSSEQWGQTTADDNGQI